MSSLFAPYAAGLAVVVVVLAPGCHILARDVTCDSSAGCPSELAVCDVVTHRCTVAVAEGEGSSGGEGEGSEGEGSEGEGEGSEGEGEGGEGEGEGEGAPSCRADGDCPTNALCVDATCIAPPAAACSGGRMAVLTFTSSGAVQQCADPTTLAFPGSVCDDATEIRVILPSSSILGAGTVCLPRAGGARLARCQNNSDCSVAEWCAALLPAPAGSTSLFSRRWHTRNLPGAADALFVCAQACASGATASDACLAGIAPPASTSVTGDDANHPSGGIFVPRAWIDAVSGPGCGGPTMLFDAPFDALRQHPTMHCTTLGPSATTAAGIIAAPGYLAPLENGGGTVLCQDPSITTTAGHPSSSLAPLGWAFVCAQDQADNASQAQFPCGFADVTVAADNTYTCAFPGGLVTSSVVSGVARPETQCASGNVTPGGVCILRGTGIVCAEGTQCDANGGCAADGRRTHRCGHLTVAGVTPNDQSATSCVSDAISGSGCLGAAGDAEGANSQCASQRVDVAGTSCAPSLLGATCGGDDDCAAGGACRAVTATCVALDNTVATSAATCASGQFQATCRAGERGETCVATSTCSSGLVCLEQVCR